MLTQRGARNEVLGKTDASTLLHIDLRGESIATLLTQVASSILLVGQQKMSTETRDETCVTGFVIVGESPHF